MKMLEIHIRFVENHYFTNTKPGKNERKSKRKCIFAGGQLLQLMQPKTFVGGINKDKSPKPTSQRCFKIQKLK